MEQNKILSADILDIIFDGRNKQYGAYDLRKTYNTRVYTALSGTIGIILAILVLMYVINHQPKPKKAEIIVEEVNLEDLKKEEKKNEPPPPPPPPKQPEPPKVEITKFTPPVIKKDIEVKEDEKPPEQSKLEDTKIGTVNVEGKKDEGEVTAPPVEKGGVGPVTEAPKVEEDYDKVFTHVEIESEFPGGAAAWAKYLQKNLKAEAPTENGAPPGKYTVILSFKVDKTGAISDITVEKDPGYGTKEEAIRVIKRCPSWKPGNQNGHAVTSIKRQAITFQVNEE